MQLQKTALELLTDPHKLFHTSRRALGLLKAKAVLRGCDLGPRVSVMGPLSLENEGRIVIGHHVYFLPGTMPTRLRVRPGAELVIGAHVGFNFAVTIECSSRIELGERTIFASMVTVRDAPGKPVVIGSDVWVAHGATIEAGVTVGEGSVISAGTTVTRDVPPHHLAIGCPARNVRLDTLNRQR